MTPARMSKIEASTRLVLAFIEAFNRHDVPAMMGMMSEDCVFENNNPAPDGTVYAGKAALTRFWQDFFKESPGAHMEIEEVFGFGYRCILRWRYEWGDLAGLKEHVRGIDLFQLKDGLIHAQFSYVKG